MALPIAFIPAILGALKGILGKVVGSKLLGGALGAADKIGASKLGQAATKVSDFVDNPVGSALKAVTPKSGLIQNTTEPLKMVDLTTKPQTKKMFNNLLQGETLGSKVFLNTLSNLGRSGAFSGSDVGQPDKNIGGMLANSFASALGQSVGEKRQESYNAEQNMLNMAQDFDPAMNALQQWQPKLLKEIEGFKNSMVSTAIERRKTGKWLNSEDMIKVQSDYIGLKNRLTKFNEGVKVFQRDYQKITDPKQGGQYDVDAFKRAEKYFMETGQPPATGTFLEPSEIDPVEYFSAQSISPAGAWQPKSKEEWWVKTSGLTQEQKNRAAMADWLSNPRLRKWAQNRGIDLNDQKSLIDLSIQYSPYIEKDRTDWEDYYKNQEMKQRQAETKSAKSTGYRIVEQYPYEDNSQGKAVVFDKNRTETLSKSNLETLTGQKLSNVAADDAIPVTFEYIDGAGNLIVTATVKDGPDRAPKRFKVPADKAKGLVESMYPGAWDQASQFATSPQRPSGVLRTDQKQSNPMDKWSQFKGGF